jgi:hypothetical protein
MTFPDASPREIARAEAGRERQRRFERLLRARPVGSMVDLGSGHGKFAQIAADLGWRVTAQDARGDRFPSDDRIRWEVGDVRDADLSGYDLVSCLGLFYHLTLTDQLSLLDRASGTPLILETHVFNKAPSPVRLSEPVTEQGYRGAYYREPDQAKHSTASWGNDDSFWPRPAALYRMLNERGYDVLVSTPWVIPTRTFFLCLPR